MQMIIDLQTFITELRDIKEDLETNASEEETVARLQTLINIADRAKERSL